MISVIHSDITKINADAIVNPANHTLLGGGGCDGMIHFAAGPELLEECKLLGGCLKGEAKLTKGYNLPARNIIHTVGPMYGYENGREAEILTSCYESCFKLAKDMKFKTIALPCLSTGCFAYPKDEASKVAIGIAKKYSKFFEKIIFVCYEELDYEIYKKLIPAPSQTSVSFQ
ncbi:MAG: macro domain-containing protein [Patescibacteria group bacterium]|jgi:O-acetyl-ADP-ribose deacetylase (regulator of RNase III)